MTSDICLVFNLRGKKMLAGTRQTSTAVEDIWFDRKKHSQIIFYDFTFCGTSDGAFHLEVSTFFFIYWDAAVLINKEIAIIYVRLIKDPLPCC
jgi:hypothetical protein